MTLGQTIAQARRKAGLSQKELAALVKKEDGRSISPQYVNDIERDRRAPGSEHLLEEFAGALGLAPELLYYAAGRLPSAMTRGEVSEDRARRAFAAFRMTLRQKNSER